MIEYVVHGLLLGSLYALTSVGLVLLFGVTKVINMAHGEMYLLGGYAAYTISSFSSPYLGLFTSPFIGFLTGMVIARTLYFPVERLRIPEADKHMLFIVATFGLSTLLQNLMLLIWGAFPVRAELFLSGTVNIFGITMYQQRFLLVALAIVTIAVLFIFLFRTKAGLALRALSQDVETTKAMGVKTDRLYALNCGIAMSLAALGGAVVSPIFWLAPSAGVELTGKLFAIVILGGMGSVWGALLSSLILGVVESTSVFFLGQQWSLVVFFLAMSIVLLIRPTGIFGEERLV